MWRTILEKNRSFIFLSCIPFLLAIPKLPGQQLDLIEVDSLWIGNRIADEFCPIEGSSIHYLLFSDSLFMVSKAGVRHLAVPRFEEMLSASVSLYGNSLGYYQNHRYWLFDIEQQKIVDSFVQDINYNALINFSSQDSQYIYLVNYYPNDFFQDLGHDRLKVYKYDKWHGRIEAHNYLNIGAEISLAPLNFQLIDANEDYLIVGTPLAGKMYLVDKTDLSLQKTFTPRSLDHPQRRQFLSEFLNPTALKAYRHRSKAMINSYHEMIDSSAEVLAKIISLDRQELLLVYINPISYQTHLYRYHTDSEIIESIDTKSYYTNPLFASRRISLSALENIKLCRIKESPTRKVYFEISHYQIVDLPKLRAQKMLDSLAERFDRFVLIDPRSFCTSCFNDSMETKLLFFLPESYLQNTALSSIYLKRYYERKFKIKSALYFIEDDLYQYLLKNRRPNQPIPFALFPP